MAFRIKKVADPFYLVSILIGWGLDYKAVFDDDASSGRKAYNLLKKEFYDNDNTEAHKYIMKIKECNGIEDIFSPKDFHKYILNLPLSSSKTIPINSELAKGKKEMLARLFLEKIENGEKIIFDRQSEKKISEIFDWL